MADDTRRVRRDLSIGVVLLAGVVAALFALGPGLAARETASAADARSSRAARVASGFGHASGLAFGHAGGHWLIGTTAIDTTAELTGTTAGDVRAALRDGQSLAAYAEAHGVSETALVDAIVAAIQARIDAAVADGTLSQEQADALQADLAARVSEKVNLAGGHGGCRELEEEEPADSDTQST